MDSIKRSIIKTITWRIVGITIGFCVAYYLTAGQIMLSVIATAIMTALSMVLYFIHERIWIKIKWGKVKRNKALSSSGRIDDFQSSDESSILSGATKIKCKCGCAYFAVHEIHDADKGDKMLNIEFWNCLVCSRRYVLRLGELVDVDKWLIERQKRI